MDSKSSEQAVRTHWTYADMQPGVLPVTTPSRSVAKEVKQLQDDEPTEITEEHYEKEEPVQPHLPPFFTNNNMESTSATTAIEIEQIDNFRKSFRDSKVPGTPKQSRSTPSTPKTPRVPRLPKNFWTPLMRRASKKGVDDTENKMNDLKMKFEASKVESEAKIDIENGKILNKTLHFDKGIQEIILNKDDKNKLGIKVRNIKNGVYVMDVIMNSPADAAGILPGDRILQINGVKVDKFDDEKMHDLFKKLNPTGIRILINKRPLEKTIVVQKDKDGQLGLKLRGAKIHTVVKGSAAESAGLSTDFYILQINGKSVRGVKDEDIVLCLRNNDCVTITAMPWYLYEPLFKQIPIR